MIGFLRSTCLVHMLFLPLLGLTVPASGDPPKESKPLVAVVAASVTHGPGAAPPPGTPAYKPRVSISFRWTGPVPPTLKQLRAELLGRDGSPASQPAARAKLLKLGGLRPADPLDPSLWQMSAPWPGGDGADWRLRITVLKGRRTLAESHGPIRDYFLPVARPRPNATSD